MKFLTKKELKITEKDLTKKIKKHNSVTNGAVICGNLQELLQHHHVLAVKFSLMIMITKKEY